RKDASRNAESVAGHFSEAVGSARLKAITDDVPLLDARLDAFLDSLDLSEPFAAKLQDDLASQDLDDLFEAGLHSYFDAPELLDPFVAKMRDFFIRHVEFPVAPADWPYLQTKLNFETLRTLTEKKLDEVAENIFNWLAFVRY